MGVIDSTHECDILVIANFSLLTARIIAKCVAMHAPINFNIAIIITETA